MMIGEKAADLIGGRTMAPEYPLPAGTSGPPDR
jgi:hypothetical protein